MNDSSSSTPVDLRLNQKQTKAEELQTIENILNVPKIILILESPHTAEFRKTVAPARDSTGINIRKYLPSIFEDKIKQYASEKSSAQVDPYVTLINSIQYQCSLGKTNAKSKRYAKSERKDWIFCRLLSLREFRESLKCRIRKVYNPTNDSLINCCTKGDEECHNQDLVFGVLGELLKERVYSNDIAIYGMAHPYRWFTDRRVWRVMSDSNHWQSTEGGQEHCFYSSQLLVGSLLQRGS